MTRQAYSLDVLELELNQHAPNRSKASDGGIGDTAHAGRPSDHNPGADGIWTARDVTHDPAGGMDCNDLASRIVAKLGKHPALGPGAYVIWQRRIISTNRLKEGWRPYTGSNPHTKHLHVSVATLKAGFDSKLPWRLWPAMPSRMEMFTRRYRQHRIVDLGMMDDMVAAGRTGPVKATRDEIDRLVRTLIRTVDQ